MADNRRIQRVQSTPAGRASGRWTSLPGEILEQSCRRVGIASVVFASVWALTLVLGNVVFAGEDPMWPWPGNVFSGLGIALSLGMLALARWLSERRELLLKVGLGFEVLTALLIGVLNFWGVADQTYDFGRVSWVALVILVYPTIAPNTPVRILGASLIAATMDPVGYIIALSRGLSIELSTAQAVSIFLPNYIAAVLAVIPAEIITGLGRQVRQARELGSYRLGEVLGKGGMGEVHRAEHRMLARPAAIKLIRPEVLGGDGRDASVAVERFKREAQAAATLRSPNTIELYDFGITEDGTFYYAMELLDGVNLEALVERFGPLPPERAVHFLRQAASSLAEAHVRGLIHRDIKPSNLHTTRLGLTVDHIKILDFGLVKVTRPSRDDPTLTAPHVTTGTPAFMSPEAALGEPLTGKADVYSLGCVAYWLLTGQMIFEADTPMKVMMRHVKDEPPRASQRSEFDIPLDLDGLIASCLAKRPDDRPDAVELLQRLADLPLERPWTDERARRWWEVNMPGEVQCGPCTGEMVAPALNAQ